LSFSISVAMCTHNGGRFLPEQLASIAAQDRLPDQLVVCDDGSTDNTHEIVKEFAGRSAFTTSLIVNNHRLGSTKNFEKAISLCQGDIVALADQDDVWYSYKLKAIETALLDSGAAVGAFSDANLIDDNSRLLPGHLWEAFSFDSEQQRRFASPRALEVLVKHPVVTGATMAFRRELFKILAPIPSNHIHDRWISFLLATRGCVIAIPQSLMKYRCHSGQQEGLPPQSRSELISQARTRQPGFHLEEIEQFHTLYERIKLREADFPHAQHALEEIESKISHLSRRSKLPQQRLARIPLILRESFNLGYWRYSAGWNSIARDLIIR